MGILTAMIFGSAIVWFRLWLTQIAYDTKVFCFVFEVWCANYHAVHATLSGVTPVASPGQKGGTEPGRIGCGLPPQVSLSLTLACACMGCCMRSLIHVDLSVVLLCVGYVFAVKSLSTTVGRTSLLTIWKGTSDRQKESRQGQTQITAARVWHLSVAI